MRALTVVSWFFWFFLLQAKTRKKTAQTLYTRALTVVFFFATGKDTEKAAQTLQTRALTVLDTQAQRAKTGKSKPRQI